MYTVIYTQNYGQSKNWTLLHKEEDKLHTVMRATTLHVAYICTVYILQFTATWKLFLQNAHFPHRWQQLTDNIFDSVGNVQVSSVPQWAGDSVPSNNA